MSSALVETFCARCGKQWQPTRTQIVAGLWRVCDDCRGVLTADRVPNTPAEHTPADVAEGARDGMGDEPDAAP